MNSISICIEPLSGRYSVRKLDEKDAELIYELCSGNPLYYRYCPPPPSIESVINDLSLLPKDKEAKDKYFIGFFDGSELIA